MVGKGICDGYAAAVKAGLAGVTSPPLTPFDILLLGAAGDMETLVDALSGTGGNKRGDGHSKDEGSGDPTQMDCSAVVRLLPDEAQDGAWADLVFAHATWRSYGIMNRV